jgi:hypothetical protein
MEGVIFFLSLRLFFFFAFYVFDWRILLHFLILQLVYQSMNSKLSTNGETTTPDTKDALGISYLLIFAAVVCLLLVFFFFFFFFFFLLLFFIHSQSVLTSSHSRGGEGRD